MPDFIKQEGDSDRKLQVTKSGKAVKKINIKELNVNKDIIAVEFFLNSADVNPE